MSQHTILVIDDHALYRAGIAAMLSTAFGDVDLLGFASLDEALAKTLSAPAMVMLDIQLLGRSGL